MSSASSNTADLEGSNETEKDPRFGPVIAGVPTAIPVILVIFGAWLALLTFEVYSGAPNPAPEAQAHEASGSKAVPTTTATFSIDRIDAERVDAATTIELIAGTDASVEGWAVDSNNKLAGTVALLVDGRHVVPLTYGRKRPDVAASKGDKALVMSGYEGVIPARLLTKGDHTVALKVTPKGSGRPTVAGKIKLIVA